jgi:ribosomal protein L11 methyltransferase
MATLFHFYLAPQATEDLLTFYINENGFDAFWKKEDRLWMASWSGDHLPPDTSELLQRWDGLEKVEMEEQPDTNWNAVWESQFQPIRIGETFYIRAHFHDPAAPPVAHELVIAPEMTFGTGHHPTTLLLLEALSATPPSGKTVLDMGCGTGILSLAALCLGAEAVVAVDNDERACEVTRKHLFQHGQNAEVLHQGHVPQGPFDLILANIQLNILLAHLPTYLAHLSPHGEIWFSGVMENQVDSLTQRFVNGHFRTTLANGWAFIRYQP